MGERKSRILAEELHAILRSEGFSFEVSKNTLIAIVDEVAAAPTADIASLPFTRRIALELAKRKLPDGASNDLIEIWADHYREWIIAVAGAVVGGVAIEAVRAIVDTWQTAPRARAEPQSTGSSKLGKQEQAVAGSYYYSIKLYDASHEREFEFTATGEYAFKAAFASAVQRHRIVDINCATDNDPQYTLLATASAAAFLGASRLTGILLVETFPVAGGHSLSLEPLVELRVTGSTMVSDFGARWGELIVSQKALDELDKAGVDIVGLDPQRYAKDGSPILFKDTPLFRKVRRRVHRRSVRMRKQDGGTAH